MSYSRSSVPEDRWKELPPLTILCLSGFQYIPCAWRTFQNMAIVEGVGDPRLRVGMSNNNKLTNAVSFVLLTPCLLIITVLSWIQNTLDIVHLAETTSTINYKLKTILSSAFFSSKFEHFHFYIYINKLLREVWSLRTSEKRDLC